jgi:hypothetical protein
MQNPTGPRLGQVPEFSRDISRKADAEESVVDLPLLSLLKHKLQRIHPAHVREWSNAEDKCDSSDRESAGTGVDDRLPFGLGLLVTIGSDWMRAIKRGIGRMISRKHPLGRHLDKMSVVSHAPLGEMRRQTHVDSVNRVIEDSRIHMVDSVLTSQVEYNLRLMFVQEPRHLGMNGEIRT